MTSSKEKRRRAYIEQLKSNKKKAYEQKLKAVAAAQEKINKAVAVLETNKPKNSLNIIEKVYQGEKVSHSVLASRISAAFDAAPNCRPALRTVLKVCLEKSCFLENNQSAIYIKILPNIARFRADWIRNIEDWKPKSHNAKKQCSSLLRHLFAKYDVPLFLDQAWHANVGNADTQRKWFIHIGMGENIRTGIDLPFPMTKKIAHHFLQTPEDFPVMGGFLWGQVMALGGDERIARALLPTHIGQNFRHYDFWTSVIRFFIDNPMFDTEQYGPLVDYIENEKYSGNVLHPDGTYGPPHPNFTIKGRTADTLIRDMERWHRNIFKEKSKFAEWQPCGIPNWKSGKEDSDEEYQVVEILTAKELKNEGKLMHHCVGSYADSCGKGRKSIWSLRVFNKISFDIKRLATIEVDNSSKTIQQARGNYNKTVTKSNMHYIERWANSAKLKTANWIRW